MIKTFCVGVIIVVSLCLQVPFPVASMVLDVSFFPVFLEYVFSRLLFNKWMCQKPITLPIVPCCFRTVACQWWSPSRILSPLELRSKVQLEKPESNAKHTNSASQKNWENGRCVCFTRFVWNFSNKSTRNFKTNDPRLKWVRFFVFRIFV